MKVRFLADADLNQAIVSGLLRREPAIDFLSAHAAGLKGMSDVDVLALAAEQHRVLVSHDLGTMPRHFREFQAAQKLCPGIFLVPQFLEVAVAINELLLIWYGSEAAEWENRLVWLPL